MVHIADNNAKVFVIIPNKNGIKHLSYSLPSLEQSTYLNYQVLLIDDCSTDDSIEFVGTHCPGVKVLTNNGKKGFAGAVNTGIIYALNQGADYIAIANSDIKVLPGWIELVIGLFHKHPDAGLVGLTEIIRDGKEPFLEPQKVEYREVTNPCGCLYVCRSEVFKHIGLFDEEYFMYGEDTDFFCRLARAGYSILETNMPVWHYGEGASENRKFFITWLAYRNTIRFAIKNKSLVGVFKILLSLLNQGCNIFRWRTDAHFKRIRRYNVVINFMLIIASCSWNLFYLPKTLWLRFHANKLSG
ncbi:MAG: glycosyltransferase family 2 protein [Verrucomicrobiota bacterium]